MSQWTFVDFVLVALGGVAGALVLGIPAFMDASNDLLFMLALVGQYLGHLAVVWLISRTRHPESLGLSIEPSDVFYLGVGVVLQIGLVVVFEPLRRVLVPVGNAQEVAELLTELSAPAARVAAVAVTSLVAPLTEEIMFRGVLLKAVEHRRRLFVLVFTSVVFGLFHLLGVSSMGAGVLVFGQIFVVGLVLAHLTLRSGRLGPAIFTHAGFNLIAATVLLLPPELVEDLAG